MKKAICRIAAFLLCITMLGGCGRLIYPAPSSIPATPDPPIASTAAPSPAASATPEPILLSTDIPDVVRDENEYMLYSHTELYEDADNIYLESSDTEKNPIYAISKKTGEKTTICGDCQNFAYSDGYVYWIEYRQIDAEGNGAIDTIYKYNTATKEIKLVCKLRNCIYDIFIKGKTIYLVYERYSQKESEINGIDWFGDLYSVDLEGRNFQKITTDVQEAGLYKGKFYCTPNSEEGAPIYEYDPARRKTRDMNTATADDFYFVAGYGKLFYDSFEIGFTMEDLKTLEGTELPVIEENAFAGLGQYLLYITQEEPEILMGYDMRTGKTYRLCSLEPIGCIPKFHSTPYNTYLTDGGTHLYKIIIEGGKARLEEVTKQ